MPTRVRHLLRILRLEGDLLNVISRPLPQLVPVRRIVQLDANGRRAAALEVELVRADVQVPVLQGLGGLGREELGTDLERRVEARAREELDLAGALDAADSEALNVVRHKGGHLVLFEMTADKVREQDG